MQPRTVTHPLFLKLFETGLHDEAQRHLALNELIEAALDQRGPSPQLKKTLNSVLLAMDHPLQPAWRKASGRPEKIR